jgi:uncharacterized protein (DUF433 family)
MQLEDYFEFEKFDSKHGVIERIRLKGHRISLEHIVEPFKEGFSPERIWNALPTLTLEQVYAAVTYYLHNKAEVEAYLERGKTIEDKLYAEWEENVPPVVKRLRELKARREAANQTAP